MVCDSIFEIKCLLSIPDGFLLIKSIEQQAMQYFKPSTEI